MGESDGMPKAETIKIEPLETTGANWPTFKTDFLDFLRSQGCIRVVRKNYEKYDGNKRPSNITADKWNKAVRRKAAVRLYLRKYISELLFQMFDSEKEPRNFWSKLCEHMDSSQEVRLEQLTEIWESLKKYNYPNINNWASVVAKVSRQIIDAGGEVTEQMKVNKTLSTWKKPDDQSNSFLEYLRSLRKEIKDFPSLIRMVVNAEGTAPWDVAGLVEPETVQQANQIKLVKCRWCRQRHAPGGCPNVGKKPKGKGKGNGDSNPAQKPERPGRTAPPIDTSKAKVQKGGDKSANGTDMAELLKSIKQLTQSVASLRAEVSGLKSRVDASEGKK